MEHEVPHQKAHLHDNEKNLRTTNVSEDDVNDEARIATNKEHNLPVRQGLKAYKKAVLWSILLSSAVIMEGYDTLLVSLLPVCAFSIGLW